MSINISLKSVLSLISRCLPSFNKKKVDSKSTKFSSSSFTPSKLDLENHPILKSKVSADKIQDNVQHVGWVRILQHKSSSDQPAVKQRVKLVSTQRIKAPGPLPSKRAVPNKPLPALPTSTKPQIPPRPSTPDVKVRKESYSEDYKGQRVVHVEKMGEYGTLEAPRINTVLENKHIQHRKLDYFEDLLFESKLPKGLKGFAQTFYSRNPLKIAQKIREMPFTDLDLREECALIADELVYAHKMLDTLEFNEDNNTHWIPSPFIRERIKADEIDKIPSSPVNLHLESFKTDAESVGEFTLARMGAIYDYKDPANTIRELRAFLDEGPGSEALSEEINMRKALIAQFKKERKKNSAKKVEALKKSLIPLLLIKKGKIEEAERFINDKQRFTDDIMLQYIAAQLESQHEFLPNIEHEGTFVLSHLSMLNEKKSLLYNYEPAVHGSGLIMDEGRFIIEMADTFKRFEGKTVIFDGTGPFIDEEGNVHAAEEHLQENGEPKELTINPIFVNFTVQRDTTNASIQREINSENIDKLSLELSLLHDQAVDEAEIEKIQLLQKELSLVLQQLENNKSNYEVACNFFPILLKFSQLRHESLLPVSGASCFSGKDRTQAVVGVSLHRVGVKPAIQELQTDPTQHKRLFRNYAKRVLYGKLGQSVGTGILHSNTQKTVFKIPTFFLPELSDFSALWRRTREYPKMVKL